MRPQPGLELRGELRLHRGLAGDHHADAGIGARGRAPEPEERAGDREGEEGVQADGSLMRHRFTVVVSCSMIFAVTVFL